MKNIVIFGAGRLGFDFFFRMKNKYNIVAFWDNNPEAWGKSIYDVPITRPCTLEEIGAEEVYISVYEHKDAIEKQLNDMGIFSFLEFKEKPDYSQKNVRMPYARLIQRAYELYRIKEYESRWKAIKTKYQRICVYFIDEDSVGEMLQRVGPVLHELTEEKGLLNVFLPIIYVALVNFELIRLLNQVLYIPYDEDLLFWEYIFMEHYDELETNDWLKYQIRQGYPSYIVKEYDHGLLFDLDKTKIADNKIRELGIMKPYVCFAARNANYYKSIGRGGSEKQAYRDAKFSLYSFSIKELKDIGIQAVRMGRGEKELYYDIENCIDYAGNNPDDFMDLYIIANCLFMVTGPSGIRLIASLFHIPVLMVNAVHISFGWGGTQTTSFDMLIPKKYYDTRKGKYLSLIEIAKVENLYFDKGGISTDCGIRFEENTQEEIREAVFEMKSRLSGEWKDTMEDIEDYKKYRVIVEKMKEIALSNKKNNWGCGLGNRIPATYLRTHKYLLD